MCSSELKNSFENLVSREKIPELQSNGFDVYKFVAQQTHKLLTLL
jgi:hypothetical protein